ncbi:MAG: diguanylate cyclase [Deltaproteobacteria bacterium]|nr:diguanylate cyclase [Deltaproteobacteria bacterium]
MGQDCLVTIYSSDARQFGKRHVLGRQALTIGRGSDNTLMLENDSVSRSHCRIEQRGSSFFVCDLGSTNGTYVNDDLVTESQLRRGDQVKVGDTILKYLSGSDIEAQYHETIYRMTIVDGLTGVNNKRFLMETLEKEIPRARRHQRPLSFLMFDIDHFKLVNDNYGHLAGDFVLKDLAQLVKARLRPDDIIGRYGGEEFAVLLPETTLEGSAAIAEELRKMIDDHRFEFEQEIIDVSVSIGCAQLADDFDVARFIKLADENLYRAKRGGRNQVVF